MPPKKLLKSKSRFLLGIGITNSIRHSMPCLIFWNPNSYLSTLLCKKNKKISPFQAHQHFRHIFLNFLAAGMFLVYSCLFFFMFRFKSRIINGSEIFLGADNCFLFLLLPGSRYVLSAI